MSAFRHKDRIAVLIFIQLAYKRQFLCTFKVYNYHIITMLRNTKVSHKSSEIFPVILPIFRSSMNLAHIKCLSMLLGAHQYHGAVHPPVWLRQHQMPCRRSLSPSAARRNPPGIQGKMDHRNDVQGPEIQLVQY